MLLGKEHVKRRVPALPSSYGGRAMMFSVYTQDKKTLWCPQNRGQCHVTALVSWNQEHRDGHAVAISVKQLLQRWLWQQSKKVRFETIWPVATPTQSKQYEHCLGAEEKVQNVPIKVCDRSLPPFSQNPELRSSLTSGSDNWDFESC